MQVFDITCEQAQKAIQTAIAKSKELNIQVTITVVDYGGNLKAFTRMDGTLLASIDISQKKAKTARYFEIPSGAFGQLTQPGGPFYGVEITNKGLVTFPGGMPIKDKNGKVIGAIGVSGSTVENDQLIAEVACNSLLS